MAIKLNWGFGITVAITLFCGGIITLVYSSFQQPIYMVSENYYADEIKYQEKIEHMKNVATLSSKPTLKFLKEEKKVILTLPEDTSVTKGNIHFFRPSDSRMDFNSELTNNELNAWQFNALRMQPGLWKVKINWKDPSNKEFYSEHTLVVPE